MVFSIFGKIAMRAGFRNGLDDARTLFLLAPAQLFLERLESSGGHRDLVHHLFLPAADSPRSFHV
jgi:hypothetical protein